MIRVNDLRFRYAGNEADTIRGLGFEVADGEIFGFLGPSGAGKSTVQKIIIGILRRYQGQVEVLGQDLATHGEDYYEHIGVSFELPNLFGKLTARENLAFFGELYSGKEAMDHGELLARVGLEADGDRRVADFSKGMKMRLNFCRALINRPRLLFLDEPTSGQDPRNARRIKDIIAEQRAQGVTVFLTTHDMTVADEICDRVAFIVAGKVRLIDSPHELAIRHGKKVVRVEYREDGQPAAQEFTLEGIGQDETFARLLQSQTIETIHTLEASLEDIFIEVTGTSLTGEP